MEEDDFSETVSEKTLSTSQGKSLFVLDKEEQLPNCSDICKPTPEKECALKRKQNPCIDQHG